MRRDLTAVGFEELRTPNDVDRAMEPGDDTMLVVVNSVCGCAARNARPAVRIALDNPQRPDRLTTVFAGQDTEATAKARQYFTGYRPSSPQIALFKDRKLVFMLERHQIEGREADAIAQDLKVAFDQHCAA
jgi:putative YphP/YqiW family bacilliredoxin